MPDFGKLILRLTVAALMLPHGIAKLSHGVSGLGDMLANKGLPRFISYGVFVGEVIAPLLMIVGLYTRPAAAIFAFNMVIAVALAHSGDLFHLGKGGGYALELQSLYFFGAVAVALFGSGKYALSRGVGRWD